MSIDEWSEQPLYLQIADILRERMTSGQIPPGGKLPTESELMEEFGVARGTVRAAIKVLRDEGIAVAKPARGTFHRPKPST